MKIELPWHQLNGLSFSIYNAEEIKKLSVKEITNPEVFDSLMHPTFGGLYDPALGPNDRNDVCSTCRLTSLFCPGHMGHIVLSLPVYNPVFFRIMIQLLRGSCFNCHQLLANSAQIYLFKKQMELLEYGLVHQVYELKDVFSGLQTEWGTTADAQDKIEQGLNEAVAQAVQEIDQSYESKNHVKNVMDVRQNIIKDFMAENFKASRGKCCHCSKHVCPVRSEYNSKVFLQTDADRKKTLQHLRNLISSQKKKTRPREDEDKENSSTKVEKQHYLTPVEAREHLRKVWKHNGSMLTTIFRSLDMKCAEEHAPTDVFFLEVVPVAPSKFRPISQMGDKSFENGQTTNLSRVLSASITMHQLLIAIKNYEKTQEEISMKLFTMIPGETANDKLQNAWIALQTRVNCVVDSDLDRITPTAEKGSGIKQLLEKKEGVFRKHMMGKRVNYAARSVISPDPYINTNEIGVPDIFAKKLTYPQPVTPWNVQELRQAVINGPMEHPGAVLVEDENGNKTILSASNITQREAIAKQLLVSSGNAMGHKKVYRHLKNGDVMLINRQPTLHRPSIQAHRARILPKEKTLRLHYANCNAYNADFDGDEMNAHFPQSEIARSEAYALASTDFQYLVPKNGLPLAGLIQDHIIAGVKLTLRGRFFSRQDYQHLVFSALTDKNGRVKQLPPAILKPLPLWSGKQVFSTLLLNLIPSGMKPMNLLGKTKMSPKEWVNSPTNPDILAEFSVAPNSMSESEVVFRNGELLCGVMDKAHFGATPFGLVHCVYELYGGEVAGRLLTSSARLFTSFLQLIGFTLGVEDILVTKEADTMRKKFMSEAKHTGPSVAAKALNLESKIDHTAIVTKYEEAHFSKDDGELKDLDLSMKGKTDEYQNKIAKACIPQGLHKRFPHNNLQLMVCAGAKGSQVNCMQISCLLGQIELEGRRPPLMMSGRFLPSFLPYDTSPRAGGFVDGRFLTGIRPQEYFFHCMAGREGLIDTAVKTSRSGYLQRCIIKHLEGIAVEYDLTVRDSDGSIIQFQYGEDSSDIGKSKVLAPQHFPFLISNQDLYLDAAQLKQVEKHMDMDAAKSHWKKIKKWKKKYNIEDRHIRKSAFLMFCNKTAVQEDSSAIENAGRSRRTHDLIEQWKAMEEDEKEKYMKHLQPCPSPLMSQFKPDRYFGSLSEKLATLTDKFIKEDPYKLLSRSGDEFKSDRITADRLETLIKMRSVNALAPPGEAVGLLAAQSIGEPSTQMTLNTFHFAGRGEMNVTLGIPRLREILMIASSNIKTPTMDFPVLNTPYAKKHANQLKKKLNKVYLSQVLEDVEVTEFLSVKDQRNKSRNYRIKCTFLPRRMYKDEYYVDSQRILKYMERHFFKHLCDVTVRLRTELSSSKLLSTASVQQSSKQPNSEVVTKEPNKQDQDDFSDDDQNDGDATATKHRERQQDSNEYMGEEEEREAVVKKNEELSDEELDEMETQDAMQEESYEEISETAQLEPLIKLSKHKKKNAEIDQKRINEVTNSSFLIDDYTYDADHEEWCEVTLKIGSLDSKLDMASVVEQEAKRCVIYQVPSISRCFLTESKKIGEEGEMHLKTEGVNIHEMYTYSKILDLSKLYCNEIHAIANTYGIEAARTVIVKEITDVFAAYGIGVDYRHLSLVADYMTFEGSYKPFNRMGIESNASPLQKMSFETTMHFLRTATIHGIKDDLKSPSARLVVGRVVSGGTGSFELVQPLK